MNLLLLLDIVVGVVFLYVILALVASSVNEAIATILNSRAKWLRLGLESLLQGLPKADRKEKLNAMLSSPAIGHLGLARTGLGRNRKRVDTDTIAAHWPVDRLQSREFLHALLSTQPFDAKLVDHVSGTHTGALDQIREGVRQLPAKTPIRYAMDAMLTSDGVSNIDQFHDAFDQWYEQFQQQIRRWYARKTRLVLWIVSLGVVIALNADTVLLIKTLGINSETRKSIVELALQMAERTKVPTLEELLNQPGRATPSLNEPAPNAELTTDTSGTPSLRDISDSLNQTRQLLASLSANGLRLGWSGTELDWRAVPAISDAPIGPFDWLSKVIGLLITAAAMTLGAPFWFDLLRDLRGLRLARVKKKESSA